MFPRVLKPFSGLIGRRRRRFSSAANWTSQGVRLGFLNFFRQHQHEVVASSSIVPKSGDGTYFVNSGMNQFKPILLGETGRSSGRVANCQKCIRLGGKHNDLEEVGTDGRHLTFFEMLGSWSFGDYFKRDACRLALRLLTQVYGVPAGRLYVSYFAGGESLPPDLETRDVWLELGVPACRIVAGSARDNFWEAGGFGPCGPCTEIHYDAVGDGADRAHCVNSDSEEVVELWNLVFMTHCRLPNGEFVELRERHVDGGMGLERLCAILQEKKSIWETDLFSPILQQLSQLSGVDEYRGFYGSEDADGVDTAYRIVADHLRLLLIAIADGVKPASTKLNSPIRRVLHRCFHFALQSLKLPPGQLSSIVPLVAQILGPTYPEVLQSAEEVVLLMDHYERRYAEQMLAWRKCFAVRWHGPGRVEQLPSNGRVEQLPSEVALQFLDGRLGAGMPRHVLEFLCRENGVTVDWPLLDASQRQKQEEGSARTSNEPFRGIDLAHFEFAADFPPTDGSSRFLCRRDDDGLYFYDGIEGTILAIHQDGHWVAQCTAGKCLVLIDRTCFYPEGGGQPSDVGFLSNEGVEVAVDLVQESGGRVLHQASIVHGALDVGSVVTCHIDQESRLGHSRAHSATHLLLQSVDDVVGSALQSGSSVFRDRLSLQFSCAAATLSLSDAGRIQSRVRELIAADVPAHTQTVTFAAAQRLGDVRYLRAHRYPELVRLVRLGDSKELCCGTHVMQTSDVGHFCLTSLTGKSDGVKSVVAHCGSAAEETIGQAESLLAELKQLLHLMLTTRELRDWSSVVQLANAKSRIPIPVELHRPVADLRKRIKSALVGRRRQLGSGRSSHNNTFFVLSEKLRNHSRQSALCSLHVDFGNRQKVCSALVELNSSRPLLVYQFSKKISDSGMAVLYLPKGTEYDVEQWADHIAVQTGSKYELPVSKFASMASQICFMDINGLQSDTQRIISIAEQYFTD